MNWLRDPAWQQGVAVLLVVLGAVLTYHGTAGTDDLGALAIFGFALFCLGIAVPLLSQWFRPSQGKKARSEDA